MIYDWYRVFNLAEFQALNLVSKTYTLNLEGIGLKDILVTQGNTTGITYEGTFLSIQLNEKNPFEFDGKACFIAENQDVYLGVQVAN